MEVFKSLHVIKNSCIGLGFFDGVHRGHQILIQKLVELSNKTKSKSVILTFQKSPAEYFIEKVDYITTNGEKEELLSSLGVDYVIGLDFNEEMVRMSAEDYLKNIIRAYFSPKYILSGFNHTFGNAKSGTPKFLKDNEKKYGYKYIEIPPVKYGNEVISSTLIRNYLKAGNIKKANDLLGHKFKISGTVKKGNQIGKTIGFPTANINYPVSKPEIPYGVYCVEVTCRGKYYKGMLNYGIKPTIDRREKEPVAEVYIIGFDDNIYGENINIFLKDKIRDEKKFASLEELKKQIKEDLKRC